MDGLDASVDFLVIWGWKSRQNWMLGCAETIQKKTTTVFVIFNFFMFFVVLVSSGRPWDLIWAFWTILESLGHNSGDFRGSWRCIEISMNFRISPGAPRAEGSGSGEGKVVVRGPYTNKSQIANLLLTTESQQDWIPETCRLKDRLRGDC